MFYIAAFILTVILLYLLTWFWPPDSPWSPWWKTNKTAAHDACKLANITKKDIVYELGSGEGDFILTAAKEFGARAVGIEIDPTRYLYSKLRIFLSRIPKGQICVIKKDFKQVDISSATVVYMYLVPRALKDLMPKLKTELKPGTRVISYRYEIDLPLIAENKKHKYFLYKM